MHYITNKDLYKIMIGIVIVITVIAINPLYVYSTSQSLDIIVTKTERVTTGSGDSLSSKYLVYTNDETFENTDTMWYWKWNSSDLHGKIQPNAKYTVKVYGWRIPFLSQYRNIVIATPL